MKFERRQVEKTIGTILAHNVSDLNGRRVLRKGVLISEQEIATVQDLGREFIYIAELEHGDVSEAEAARRSAELIHGEHIRVVGAATGRTNLLAEKSGVLHVDVARLNAINTLTGVTLATLRDRSVVPERQMLASIKVIPYGLPAGIMAAIEDISEQGPIVELIELPPKRVDMLYLGAAAILDKLEQDFRNPLEVRVRNLGSTVEGIHRLPTDVEDPVSELAAVLKKLPERQIDLLIIAGETAIMDPRDIIPSAIEKAGGFVETVGAPVDPGNLLMIAYLDELPILGAPGCARSLKENVMDWVLPRLLSGERLKRSDITSLGHGGLLEDIRERPFPRSKAGENQDA